MQAELDAEETVLSIQIVGVNEVGLEYGNGQMTSGRALPWLQSLVEENPWTLWQVEFRDVVILGPGNERLDVFNVTEHDLSDPANYATLKSLLLDAANQ